MPEDEVKTSWPFEVSVDDEIDPASLTFQVNFSQAVPEPKREELQAAVEEWANKGINEGYGDGKMHYLDTGGDEMISDEELAPFDWGEEGNSVEFFADMGSADLAPVLEALCEELLKLNLPIEGIRVGSGYEW